MVTDSSSMRDEERLEKILLSTDGLREILILLAQQDDFQLWLSGGAVRNAVWDRLHHRKSSTPSEDVDVVWFDSTRADAVLDLQIERRLSLAMPQVRWDVKNQARMPGTKKTGARNLQEAMRGWPDTASAVAVRLDSGNLVHMAPFGLGDLFALRLRAPGDGDRGRFRQRIDQKRWLDKWPQLVVDWESKG